MIAYNLRIATHSEWMHPKNATRISSPQLLAMATFQTSPSTQGERRPSGDFQHVFEA